MECEEPHRSAETRAWGRMTATERGEPRMSPRGRWRSAEKRKAAGRRRGDQMLFIATVVGN
jgi:hypothetical protein